MSSQSDQQSQGQQCHVVSSFIFSIADGESRVALFRRSDKVRTYRHHLAPISGSIDPQESAVTAAWRELQEETTLTAREVDLWRVGKPYTFSDSSIGRQWTVNPFAFRLKSPKDAGRGADAIKIDWEHEGWEWYDPGDVKDDGHFGGVPRLAESLHRVWFEAQMNEGASKALRSGLEELKTDHQSGSHELTTVALKAFRDVLVYLRDDPRWWDTARMAAWHLWKNGRESMGAATLNAFLGVLGDMESMQGHDLKCECTWNRVLAVVDHHLERRRTMPAKIKDTFAAYLTTETLFSTQTESNSTLTLLTLSASSTIRDSILDAFASLPISHLDLRILESRPLFEGASMASSLVSEFQSKFPSSSDRHLKLSVHTDASAALASIDVDFVLLGADRISSSGWVSNKTGSLPAVLSAKHVSPNAKVLIFSELEKLSESDAEEHKVEDNDPTEVVAPWIDSGVKGVKVLEELREVHSGTAHCTVDVKNVYFEWVPAELIDAYVCEEGTLDLAKIREKAVQVQEKAKKYLGSL